MNYQKKKKEETKAYKTEPIKVVLKMETTHDHSTTAKIEKINRYYEKVEL